VRVGLQSTQEVQDSMNQGVEWLTAGGGKRRFQRSMAKSSGVIPAGESEREAFLWRVFVGRN